MYEPIQGKLCGDLCAECGTPFANPRGWQPRYCDGCGPENLRPSQGPKRTVPCSACTRKFHTAFGLSQHRASTGH